MVQESSCKRTFEIFNLCSGRGPSIEFSSPYLSGLSSGEQQVLVLGLGQVPITQCARGRILIDQDDCFSGVRVLGQTLQDPVCLSLGVNP